MNAALVIVAVCFLGFGLLKLVLFCLASLDFWKANCDPSLYSQVCRDIGKSAIQSTIFANAGILMASMKLDLNALYVVTFVLVNAVIVVTGIIMLSYGIRKVAV